MIRIDPVQAWLEGFASVWSRCLLFFVAAILAHTVGLAGALLMYEEGYYFDFDPGTFAALPASWMLAVIQSLAHPLGSLFVPLLFLLFLLMVFSERSLVHLVTVLAIVQAWGTFLVHRFVRDEAELSLLYVADHPPPFAALGYGIVGAFTLLVLLSYALLLYARARAIRALAAAGNGRSPGVHRGPRRRDPRRARLDLWENREDREDGSR